VIGVHQDSDSPYALTFQKFYQTIKQQALQTKDYPHLLPFSTTKFKNHSVKIANSLVTAVNSHLFPGRSIDSTRFQRLFTFNHDLKKYSRQFASQLVCFLDIASHVFRQPSNVNTTTSGLSIQATVYAKQITSTSSTTISTSAHSTSPQLHLIFQHYSLFSRFVQHNACILEQPDIWPILDARLTNDPLKHTQHTPILPPRPPCRYAPKTRPQKRKSHLLFAQPSTGVTNTYTTSTGTPIAIIEEIPSDSLFSSISNLNPNPTHSPIPNNNTTHTIHDTHTIPPVSCHFDYSTSSIVILGHIPSPPLLPENAALTPGFDSLDKLPGTKITILFLSFYSKKMNPNHSFLFLFFFTRFSRHKLQLPFHFSDRLIRLFSLNY
jgi:hypothetical protein